MSRFIFRFPFIQSILDCFVLIVYVYNLISICRVITLLINRKSTINYHITLSNAILQYISYTWKTLKCKFVVTFTFQAGFLYRENGGNGCPFCFFPSLNSVGNYGYLRGSCTDWLKFNAISYVSTRPSVASVIF